MTAVSMPGDNKVNSQLGRTLKEVWSVAHQEFWAGFLDSLHELVKEAFGSSCATHIIDTQKIHRRIIFPYLYPFVAEKSDSTFIDHAAHKLYIIYEKVVIAENSINSRRCV